MSSEHLSTRIVVQKKPTVTVSDDMVVDPPAKSKTEKMIQVALSNLGFRLVHLGEQIKDADYMEVAKKAKDWVADHPREIAQYTSTGAIVLYPGLVVAPIVGFSGFGPGGVAA
ncbi:MAG: hypothetical protein Q9166_001966, partial [cf. Caloplaca sp. 2 TL-2023]